MSAGYGGKYVYYGDRKGAEYDNRAYDNSAYTGSHRPGSDQPGSHQPGSHLSGSHQKASHYGYPEDSQDHRVGYRREYSIQSRKRCWVIVAVILFGLLIAAAIAVGVYFGVTSNDKDKSEDPAVATVQMSMTLNETWNDALNDPTSPEYKALASEAVAGMDSTMEGVEGYKGTDVAGFSEGSVVVDLNIGFTKMEITRQNGSDISLSKTQDVVAFVNDKFEKKKGTVPFAAKVLQEKTKAEFLTGEVGRKDLGESCSTPSDCQDRKVNCPTSTKVCTCASGYYNKNTQGTKGSCSPGKSLDNACDLPQECAYPGGACVDKKCGCYAAEKFRKDTECVDKIDIDKPGCSNKEQCRYADALCEQGTCKCRDDWYKGNNMCARKLDIGGSCSVDGHCKRGKCTGGICRCPDGQFSSNGECRPMTDNNKLCSIQNVHLAMEDFCEPSWSMYSDTGIARHFQNFLGCMYFHTKIWNVECDLKSTLNSLRMSSYKTAQTPMELDVCTTSFDPDVGKDVEVILSTDKERPTYTVQILLPNDMVSVDKYVAFGLSNTKSMPASLIYTAENIAPKDETEARLKIRYSNSQVRTKPDVRMDTAKSSIHNFRIHTGEQYTSIMFREDKTFKLENLGFSGERFFLFAYGPMINGDISKHSHKALKESNSNLTCGDGDDYRLPLLIDGMQTKEALCTSERTVRYLLEYHCIKTVATYTQEEKCIARASAKYCVMSILKEAGLNCNIDVIDEIMDTEYVKWKLLVDYPSRTACGTTLQPTSCEEKYIQHASALFVCQQSMMQAALLSKFWPDFTNITSSDGSHKLTCSLWRGMFQCFSKFLDDTDCTPGDIEDMASKALTAAQKFLIQTMVETSELFNSSSELSIIDYKANCPVADLSPQVGECPSDSLIADSIIARCGLTVAYLEYLYPAMDMCLANTTMCGEQAAAEMFRIHMCDADPKEATYRAIEAKTSWFKDNFELDLANCKEKLECMADLWSYPDCNSGAGLVLIEDKLKDQNEICVSNYLMETVFLPNCFDRHNLTSCKAMTAPEVWKMMIARVQIGNQKETSAFLNCDGVQLDQCAAQTLTTLFTCYDLLSQGKHWCSVDHCVQTAEPTDGCTAPVAVEDVKERARSIYGTYFECPFGVCGEGGFSYFRGVCSPPWSAWNQLGACRDYEAFLFCAASVIIMQGQDDSSFCGSETLQNHIAAEAGSEAGNICGTPAAGYAALDGSLPDTKQGFCTNPKFYRYMFTYWCPAKVDVGTNEEQCLAEIARRVCLYNTLEQIELKCSDEEVWVTSSSPAVSDGIFSHVGCESDYMCVTSTLAKSDTLTGCFIGINQFLTFAGLDVDIDNLMAKGSNTMKLKCKVFNIMSACAHTVLYGDPCQNHMDQVQIALNMLASLIPSPDAAKTDIFDECPAFVPIATRCPDNDELLYAVIGSCGYNTVRMKNSTDIRSVCAQLSSCAASMLEGWRPSCPEINSYLERLTSPDNLQYINVVLGVDCASLEEEEKPGRCPVVEGVGTCVEECEGDSSCDDDMKCCSNNCGHVCMEPAENDWRRCSNDTFTLALRDCGPPFYVWKDTTKSATERCLAYEAFVGCTITNYLAAGADICVPSVPNIDAILRAGAEKANHGTPQLCANSELGNKLPANRDAICTNTLVYSSILTYFCPTSAQMASNNFTTDNADKNACLKEITRVVCLGRILNEGLKLSCSDTVISATKNLPDARKDVFTNAPKCEETFPCLFEVSELARSNTQAQQCLSGLNGLLYMSTLDINVDTQTTINPNEKLKCKVLDIIISCAVAHSTKCKAAEHIRDFVTGALWYANFESQFAEAAVPKVDIYKECQVDVIMTPCPVNDELLYSTVAFCTLTAARMVKNQEVDQLTACTSVLGCINAVKAGWSATCDQQTLDELYSAMFSETNLAYVETVTGLQCPNPEL